MKGHTYFFLGGIAAILAIALILRLAFPVSHRTVFLGKKSFTAEVVSTPEARAKGLSGRSSLKADEAMLFLFFKADRYAFWMMDMRFPIDILWLKGNVIVDIAKDVLPPEENTPSDALPRYIPRFPADAVLEIPAGTIDQVDVRIGDSVKGL